MSAIIKTALITGGSKGDYDWKVENQFIKEISGQNTSLEVKTFQLVNE